MSRLHIFKIIALSIYIIKGKCPAEKKKKRTITENPNGFHYKYHYEHYKPSTFNH